MEKIKISLKKGVTRASLLDRIAVWFVGAVVFLLPIFFIPSAFVPFQYAKSALVIVGTLVAFLLWMIGRIKDGTFLIPWHSIFAAFLALPVVALLSALVSGHASLSLIGTGFDLNTVSFIAALVILTFLISELFRSKEKIFYSYVAFIACFFVISIFEIIRLFAGPQVLVLQNFTDIGSNLLGRWSDLSIFAGLGIVLSTIALELLEIGGRIRAALYAVIVLGFFFIGVSNFYVNLYFVSVPITVLIGFIALIVFSYLLSYGQSKHHAATEEVRTGLKLPTASFIVLILSILFTLAGGFINTTLDSYFKVTQLDARPSWQATGVIAKDTIEQGVKPALLGSGPNRFTPQWLLFRPASTNQTQFWNVDFAYGIGFIPTTLVTSGILGLLSWLILIGLFIIVGVKALFSGIKDRFALFLLLSSFIAALYLWIMDILYVPSIVTLSLTFIFSGLFLASVLEEGIIQTKVITPFKNQQFSFIAMLLISILMLGVIAWGNIFVSKVVSNAYAEEAGVKFSAGDYNGSGNWLLRALSLDSHSDVLYREVSQVLLTKMNVDISDKTSTADAVKTNVQNDLSQAVAAAQQAVITDPTNYQNWISLGDVYQTATVLKIDQAYPNAQNAYNQALAVNPSNPSIYLSLARLDVAQNDLTDAKAYAIKALQAKPDYLDAIAFISQLQVNQGDTAGAISLLESAVSVDPNDPSLYFQIGNLYYSEKDYTNAISALEQSVKLSPTYAPSEYYLGLSYYAVGRTSDSLAVFQTLLAQNPGNQDLETIISNLQQGKSPVINEQLTPSVTVATSTATTSKTSTSKTKKK